MRVFEGFMHGVNLGGWISQMDYETREHYESFITEKDIEYIASLGLDHVRVPVDYIVLEEEDGTIIEEGYKYLDNCLEWCKKNSLRMIIDVHRTFGYTFDPLVKENKTEFFTNEQMQDRFYELWRRIATRYGEESQWVAFELLNEIVEQEISDEWNEIALKTIKIIRDIAPDTWIIYGGTRYNSVVSVPHLVNPKDDKVVYTFHCYEPLAFTHQGAYWIDDMPRDFRIEYPKSLGEYREISAKLPKTVAGAIMEYDTPDAEESYFEAIFECAIKKAQEDDMPLYCGEYGVIDLADDESKMRWLITMKNVLDKYNIGRAYWNYKAKDFGIVDIEDEAVQRRLVENI